jgi:hypothetical protein
MADKSPKWNFRSAAERLSIGASDGAIVGDLGLQADNGTIWYFDGSSWQPADPPFQWNVNHFNLSQSDPAPIFLNLINDPSIAFSLNAPETLFVSPGTQVSIFLKYRYAIASQVDPLDVTCRVHRNRSATPAASQTINVNSDSVFFFDMSPALVQQNEIFAVSFQPTVITDPVIVTMSVRYNVLTFT